MSLFRRFFYAKPPDRLVEISERVYVFDCCFSSDVMGEDEYKDYFGGIVAQLQDHFPDASFMVFNFREGEQRSLISDVLSQYDMTVMDYPRQYESCPLLPLEMIHHFLKSSESWLSLEGQQNVLLMHCERGAWPVLAFMLSGILLYRKQCQGEQKTLEMVQKQAPMELLCLSSPLNPQPSQLRYLQYISRRDLGSDWPPLDTPLLLDCLILRDLPHFEGRKGYRPILRVYGKDPKAGGIRSSMLLFSTPKIKKHNRLYRQEECILVKLDVQCRVEGDVVLECIHLHDDLVREEMVFRIMFHTAFVPANILMVQRDEMDILWDAKDQFPKEFKAEVLFSGADAVVPTIATATISEDENDFDIISPEEFFEVGEIFSDVIDGPGHKRDSDGFLVVDTSSDDSEGTSVYSSQAAASPPPFSSEKPNRGTMLPPPPPFAYERRNRRAVLLPPSYPSPPPPPPPPPPRKKPDMCIFPRETYSLKPLLRWVKITRALRGSLWDELERHGEAQTAPVFDVSEIETFFSASLFSATVQKPEEVYMIDLRRAFNTEIMLANVKMPLPDMMAAVLAMDDSVLDIDQIENLIKFCPTKEEMELLKNYAGDKETLGKCEQYFLELMKVPRVESKLRVFSFKIQFGTQITELKNSLNAVNSACEEVRSSQRLKEIMKNILYLGNTLNQGTAKGYAVGFRLDSLLKLSDTHAPNSKMTLLHYLCKVLASKASDLLDFHKDLESLESASKIQSKSLAAEMQAITKGLEKLNQELTASESDGPVSEVFRKTLKDFNSIAETEVATVLNLHTAAGRNADALVYYFGEDPYRFSFEQVTATLVKFISLFKKAHEENVKQAYYRGPGAPSPPPPPPPPPTPPPIFGSNYGGPPQMRGRALPPPPPPPPPKRGEAQTSSPGGSTSVFSTKGK